MRTTIIILGTRWRGCIELYRISPQISHDRVVSRALECWSLVGVYYCYTTTTSSHVIYWKCQPLLCVVTSTCFHFYSIVSRRILEKNLKSSTEKKSIQAQQCSSKLWFNRFYFAIALLRSLFFSLKDITV